MFQWSYCVHRQEIEPLATPVVVVNSFRTSVMDANATSASIHCETSSRMYEIAAARDSHNLISGVFDVPSMSINLLMLTAKVMR